MPGKDPFAARFHPCKHVHVSGRRCATRIGTGVTYCEQHGDPRRYHCSECDSMKKQFVPPKGW